MAALPRNIFRPPAPHESLAAAVRRELPVLLVLSLLTLGMELAGWLRGFETYALDSLLLLNTREHPSQLMIVNIDDQDYRELFGGASPIDPDQLAKVLSAIERGKPRVIAVDLDTSAPQFAGRRWPQVVWARDGYPYTEPDDESPPHVGHDAEVLRLPALGGGLREKKIGDRIETTPPSGLVLFPQDYDGVVRRYQRFFESEHSEPKSELHGGVDSFPWAIAREYARASRTAGLEDCAECQRVEELEKHPGHGELVLNFAGEHYRHTRLPARFVLEGAAEEYWPDASPLRDAIVLLGGTYRAARDEYITPVGPRFGVELIAHAVDSELQGGGIRELNRWMAVLLDLLTGLAVIYINWRFPGRLAGGFTLVAIVLLSPLASLLAFRAIAFWFNFSAVLVGLWIHLLWEQSQERRHLRAELEKYKVRERSAAT